MPTSIKTPGETLSPSLLVSPLQGTDSTRDMSRGNTLPFCQRPWAMTAWSPQTHEDRWLFQYRHPKLQGFRATRQPSPWIGDYAPLTLWPQQGPRILEPTRRASACRYDRSIWYPHYQEHFLLRHRCRVKLAPTDKCAILRAEFEEGDTCRLIIDLGFAPGSFEIDPTGRAIRVSTKFHMGGAHGAFTGFYLLCFSKPLTQWGFLNRGSHEISVTSGWKGDKPQAFLEFQGRDLETHVASSFISFEQASENLSREIGPQSLISVAAEGKIRWDDLLGHIVVKGPDEGLRRTFYTCLYRALCFPRMLHEKDAHGALYHRSPYDGQVHPGPLSADNGFWDTHRTVYPLYSLAYPKELGVILEGWLAAYRESGWLPTWSSPGHRSCMIGTHIDAVFADAIVKNIPGFHREEAFAAIWKNAHEAPTEQGVGRWDLADYLTHGFLPHGKGIHSVSATLDHAYCDWCIGQAARALGKHREADLMEARSANWKHLFDPISAFPRPKHADGSWVEPFDPHTWGGAFVEGSAWQCGLAIPHDPAGVIAQFGGPAALLKRLDETMALPPKYHIGSYQEEIHEMTEMAMADFGLYAHSNQPSHGILWWFSMAGAPAKTQYWVRRILTGYYGHGPGGLPGDEDNGEMASWFVLASIGLYPFCVGDPGYVACTPLFPEVKVYGGEERHGGDGLSFTITTENFHPEHIFIKKIELAGEPHPCYRVGHQELHQGRSLHFTASDQPALAIRNPNELPHPTG